MRVKHSTKYVSDELEDNKTKKKKSYFSLKSSRSDTVIL